MFIALVALAVGAPAANAGWQSFAPPDSSLFGPPYFVPQLVDRAGHLWVRSPDQRRGYVFDGETWSLPTIEGRKIRDWTQVVADSSGNVWMVGGFYSDPPALDPVNAVLRFDGQQWVRFSTGNGLVSDDASSALVDRAGKVWVVSTTPTGDYLSRFDGSSWKNFAAPAAIRGIGKLLCEDRARNLWLGASGHRAIRFDGANWAEFTLPAASPSGVADPIHGIVESRDGSLWFASSFDVHHRAAGSFEEASPPPQAGCSIASLHVDRLGTLWVSVSGRSQGSGSGLWFHDGKKWRSLLGPGEYSGVSRSAGGMTDWAGALWFGSYREVRRFDGESTRDFSPLLAGSGFISGTIDEAAILASRESDLWLNPGSGLDRFDGNTVTHYSTGDGLAGDDVSLMHEDLSGRLWFGNAGGITSFDGQQWRHFGAADGLVEPFLTRILDDTRGNIWAWGDRFEWSGLPEKLHRFDGTRWSTWTFPDSMPFFATSGAWTDRRGNLWVATMDTVPMDPPGSFRTYHNGLARFDGRSWSWYDRRPATPGPTYPYASIWEDRAGDLWAAHDSIGILRMEAGRFVPVDLPGRLVPHGFLEDGQGNRWFDLGGPAFRFDGVRWDRFQALRGTSQGGLADRLGNLWIFGTYPPPTGDLLAHFDGSRFRPYGVAQGVELSGGPLFTDSTGALWSTGMTRYYPDFVAPVVRFVTRAPRLSSSRSQTATFSASFETAPGTEYSSRLDTGSWSEWSAVGSWAGDGLADGVHLLEARARDYAGNVSQLSAPMRFEVDATAPSPILTSPVFGQAVRGVASLRGTAADARFGSYRIEVRPGGGGAWSSLVSSNVAIDDSVLGSWDTSAFPDGAYEIRLSVTDTLGLVGTSQLTVTVDNDPPFFDVTSPVTISSIHGGDAFTTGSESHLYFAPRAFAEDALVTLMPTPPGEVPPTLPGGGTRVLDGYTLAWSATLAKPARFELSLAGVAGTSGTLALYHSDGGATWTRLGGTVEPGGGHLTLAITRPGRYALFAESAPRGGSTTIEGLTFTPRVFSPRGGFADREVGVGFMLGRAGPVTVRVYSTSGRLVRDVARSRWLGPGANLVRWDGRDREGAIVTDGMYVITVEALGETLKKPLAVVR